MSVIQVGLVDTTGKLDPELVQSAAAALNIQVMRDLPQFWNIQATVMYLPHAGKVPAGVWPVSLVKSLPPGEGGFHMDRHNQPYSKVIASPTSDEWTIDASHEIIEMLVDPAGNRLQSSNAIAIKPNGSIADAPASSLTWSRPVTPAKLTLTRTQYRALRFRISSRLTFMTR